LWVARLAGVLRGAVDRERPALLSRQALEMADRIGDPRIVLLALGAKMAWTRGPDNIHETLADGLEVVRLAHELGDPELLFYGHEELMYSAWILGDRDALATEVATMTRLAQQSRQPAKAWVVTAGLALSALWEGRLEAAEELIGQAFQLERAESWIARSSYRLQSFVLRAHRGKLAGYDDLLRNSVDEYEGYLIMECALLSAYCELGRDDEARDALERIAGEDFSNVPRDEDWLVNICLLSDACLYLRDAKRTAILYELVSPYASFSAFAQPEMALGSIAHFVGRLAAALGRHDEAAGHFEAALEANARMGGLPSLAHTQYHYAGMLLARAQPGDAERAAELVASAQTLARDIGLRPLAEKLSALAV
jgi:tetratricopeptide (TPR) repeat protein